MNPEDKYETCPKCGVKRNITEAPDCIICRDKKNLEEVGKVKKRNQRGQRIYEMRRRGMTLEEIGIKMGISAQRVQQLTHY